MAPTTHRLPPSTTIAPPPTSHVGMTSTGMSACTSWVSGSIRTMWPANVPSKFEAAIQTLPSPTATERTSSATANVSTTSALGGEGTGVGSTVAAGAGMGCHAMSPATPMPGAVAIGVTPVPSGRIT